MCSLLVPRKGNQEYVTAGARFVLRHQVTSQSGLVETVSQLRLQEGVSMDRTRSEGGVYKGNPLCAETFGAEVRRPAKQFLSRSRVHTPLVKDNQRIVHVLYSLNEATVKSQPTRIVVRPRITCSSWMWGVSTSTSPSTPIIESFFLHIWLCRSLSTTSSSSSSQEVTSSAADQTSSHWFLRLKRRCTCATCIPKSSSSHMRHCRSDGQARPELGRVLCPW